MPLLNNNIPCKVVESDKIFVIFTYVYMIYTYICVYTCVYTHTAHASHILLTQTHTQRETHKEIKNNI